MALGTSRPRNWGKEAQQGALDITLKRARVAYSVRPVKCRHSDLARHTLWLTPSHNGLTLPFIESCADLVNVRRGRWEARHPFDGRVLASGISQRDVIRATINAIWK